MTSIASLQENLPYEAYVSQETRQLGQPIWDLMTVGWDNGIPTSITEAASSSPSSFLFEQFHHLVDTIHTDCAHLSSIREIVLHPSYQQIVGMGPQALPLILRELEDNPGHWFWALRAITGEDPVLPDHQGIVAEMAQDWLDWAMTKGVNW